MYLLASSLAAAAPDSHFEHPAGLLLLVSDVRAIEVFRGL